MTNDGQAVLEESDNQSTSISSPFPSTSSPALVSEISEERRAAGVDKGKQKAVGVEKSSSDMNVANAALSKHRKPVRKLETKFVELRRDFISSKIEDAREKGKGLKVDFIVETTDEETSSDQGLQRAPTRRESRTALPKNNRVLAQTTHDREQIAGLIARIHMLEKTLSTQKQEPAASSSTGLISGSNRSTNYQATSSSNPSEVSRHALEGARHLSINVQADDFLQSSNGFFNEGELRKYIIALTPFTLHFLCVISLLVAKYKGWIDREKNPWLDNVMLFLISTWILSFVFGACYGEIEERMNRRRAQRNAGDIV